jgi:hypothetical protein
MKCSICEEKITIDPFGWENGCNAHPINDGICCYQCDINVVLPARLVEYGFKDKEIEEVIKLKLKEAEQWDMIYTD